ncbi:hypothetical protein cypCar_00004865 [Cyprinus carpio]|nr:hypothetical protein cypCar_00004865 [Cyprinus carpio]
MGCSIVRFLVSVVTSAGCRSLNVPVSFARPLHSLAGSPIASHTTAGPKETGKSAAKHVVLGTRFEQWCVWIRMKMRCLRSTA